MSTHRTVIDSIAYALCAHDESDDEDYGTDHLARVISFQLRADHHVFTDAELRARDERIIKESFRVARQTFLTSSSHIDAIIAAAEVDQ